MHLQPNDCGWIEVVCGSMFSGKTEELIRRLKRALIARQNVQAFKPVIDDRYSRSEIASHAGRRLEALPVPNVDALRAAIHEDVQVIGIDEAQFFDAGLVDFCEEMALRGVRVIVAGLDQDYLGRPFGPVPQLMTVAEFVTKTLAICVLCGNPAHRSHRILAEQTAGQVLVGSTESYQALCRRCHANARSEADIKASQGEISFQDRDLP
jgi:thymidine kinase